MFEEIKDFDIAFFATTVRHSSIPANHSQRLANLALNYTRRKLGTSWIVLPKNSNNRSDYLGYKTSAIAKYNYPKFYNVTLKEYTHLGPSSSTVQT